MRQKNNMEIGQFKLHKNLDYNYEEKSFINSNNVLNNSKNYCFSHLDYSNCENINLNQSSRNFNDLSNLIFGSDFNKSNKINSRQNSEVSKIIHHKSNKSKNMDKNIKKKSSDIFVKNNINLEKNHKHNASRENKNLELSIESICGRISENNLLIDEIENKSISRNEISLNYMTNQIPIIDMIHNNKLSYRNEKDRNNRIKSNLKNQLFKSVDKTEDINKVSKLIQNQNFILFQKLNNSPEKFIISNLKNFINNNPLYKYKINQKESEMSNINSVSKHCFFGSTFTIENKISSVNLKSNDNSSKNNIDKKNPESIIYEINKKNKNKDYKIKNNNQQFAFSYFNNYSKQKNLYSQNLKISNFSTKDQVCEKNSKDETSKFYIYENLDSIENYNKKKSNLRRIEINKYLHHKERKENLNQELINKDSNKSDLINKKMKNKHSIESFVKTPIKICLENWRNIETKKNNKSSINFYRTTLFKIPLVSMINKKFS